MSARGIPLKLDSLTLGILVTVILFGGIGLSAALNTWNTTNSKVPAAYTSGEHAGTANPADIRGSYTLADIERAFEIPIDVLARAFGAAAVGNPGAFQVKVLEETYGAAAGGLEIGTDSVRLFVSLYRGLPYTPEETTGLPQPAVSILRRSGPLNEQQSAWIDSRRVDISHLEGSLPQAGAGAEDRTIKGRTTFAELMDLGLGREEIEAAIGAAMGPRTMALRDWAQAGGLEFSSIKTALQARVDAAAR